MNVIHRDLKPDNIFIHIGLDGVNNIKIGDFGLASKAQIAAGGASTATLDPNETRSVGTSMYVAPEVRSGGKGSYTTKVDMYSLGIMFFEMCMHEMGGMERARVSEQLRKPYPTLPSDFDSDSAQADIILSLVTHDPTSRPSAAELLDSPKLPDEMESDSIRRAFAAIMDPTKPHYEKMLKTLFSPSKMDKAKDYVWDDSDQSHTALSQLHWRIAKESLEAIFKSHGAVEVPAPTLYPYSEQYNDRGDVVKLLDSSGLLLQLPYDQMLGHARTLAKVKQPILGPSYSFGRVLRAHLVGGQPSHYDVVDFNVVTTNALDLSLKEALVFKVVDQIIDTFPLLSTDQMAFQVNHCDLLDLIFDFCGIEPKARRAAAWQISKLYTKETNWKTLRIELRNPKCGVSATSLDELQRFDFRLSPNKAFVQLKTVFGDTDYYRKAGSTIAHLKEVHEFTKLFGVKVRFFISPLHCYNESFFKGGVMFSCVYEGNLKEVFAGGGRYDSLIREHSSGSIGPRHAVGVTFNWARFAKPPARSSKKASSKKATQDRSQTMFNQKFYDVLVASFDPAIRRSSAIKVLTELLDHGITAQLADDARSPDELLADKTETQPAWMVIVKAEAVKVKTLWTRDTPEADVPAKDLVHWLRGEMRERDSVLGTMTRTRTAHVEPSTPGGGDLSPYPGSGSRAKQNVHVLTAQSKSKKFNRLKVVEEAQLASSRLLQGFQDSHIVAVETSDGVLHAVHQTTKLSEPETWRRLDVSNVEKSYVRDLQDILMNWREEGAKDAFVYNFRTGSCVLYDLKR